jgi:uncharacterized membrane protein
MTITSNTRIQSIDLLRGVVMVIMALDHVRDYFHADAFLFEPTDLEESNTALFFTRFITHFCAPVFVFLAGTSARFVGQRRSKKGLSIWLVKRGLWLVFLELTIIKFGWLFQLTPYSYLLQVIWVLGVGMIFLAAFVHIPRNLMLIISLAFIFGHNAFDYLNALYPESTLLKLLHMQGPIFLGDFVFFAAYPLIPWIFVMPLGYHLGGLYVKDYTAEERIKILRNVGVLLIILFVVLRGFNIYGDANLWSTQRSIGLTISSFFNVTKYPPSLLFILITLGPSLVFLSYAEKWQGKFQQALVTIGRVPLFFYVVHIYLIHVLALIAAELTGVGAENMLIDLWVTMQPELQGYGFSLWVVYVIWIIISLGLYPVCKAYWNYKANNKDKWWLSYL